jgi:hypothetical protein
MHTLMFVLADTGVSAALGHPLGDACRGVLAASRRQIRPGLAAHGG